MDDGPKPDHIDIPLSPELWAVMHQGPVPDTNAGVAVLEQRALDELRSRHRFSEQEVDFVAQSPVFKQSAREGYLEASDRMRRKHRLPSKIRIFYPHPGTRPKTGFWSS